MSAGQRRAADGGAPLGVAELERLRRRVLEPTGPSSPERLRVAKAVLDTLGLGLEPVYRYLAAESPNATSFERWLLSELGGELDPRRVELANAIADGAAPDGGRQAEIDALEAAEPVFTATDFAFWEEHGYVIVRDAAPASAVTTLREAIWEHLGAAPEDPDSWYRPSLQNGIMLQLFRAPGIAEIHAAPRIHKAFAQLAGTADLVMTTDRCGFNPPERSGDRYRGMGLHLDLDELTPPVRPGLQGILYLTDTAANQGALRCVPGFHRRIDAWFAERPPGQSPTAEDFEALGAQPIAAGAGDLIIWTAALPHGPSANRAGAPRIVHYVTMYPTPRPRLD